MIKHFNNADPVKIFGNNKTTFISGKNLHKNKFEDFALEILEEKAISVDSRRKQLEFQVFFIPRKVQT